LRLLYDIDNKNEIGYIDWEFIHDMQGIVPDMITPEIVYLTSDFLKKIPSKWKKIQTKLKKNVMSGKTVHLAISDIENFGNEFKIRGTLKNNEGEILDFHKVVIFDKDRFEDDYIGAVITDKKGDFSLSFGKKVFSDFGLESEPDIYLKVYTWDGERFIQIGEVIPEIFEKTETKEQKIILEFGIVKI